MNSCLRSGRAAMDRRQFLGTAATLVAAAALEVSPSAAQIRSPAIKAVAFDGFAIFHPGSVFRLAEELFPGQGAMLSSLWRRRQLEYTWLRNSMCQYTDFWRVTEDALRYAANESELELSSEQRTQLMSAYLHLRPRPGLAAVLETLRKRGLRLALLTNWTPTMLLACLKGSGLEQAFEFQLSTDRVGAFKPDPAAYRMAVEVFHLQKQEIAFVAFGGWDAAGAKAFGFPTYWVDPLGAPTEELGVLPDAIFPDLFALPAFIAATRT